jgi:MOSC domain-containing protein YiiM
MESLAEAEVSAGAGLRGDRYAEGVGTFSEREGIREITLMAEEAMEIYQSLPEASEVLICAMDMRRNVLTRGVELPALIGRKFRIGGAELLGLRPCPPCTHLARLLGTQTILQGFAYSGGIYAQVLASGSMAVGCAITLGEAVG